MFVKKNRDGWRKNSDVKDILVCQSKDDWGGVWRYLDLRDLGHLLEDDRFRGQIAKHFFKDDLAEFHIMQTPGKVWLDSSLQETPSFC